MKRMTTLITIAVVLFTGSVGYCGSLDDARSSADNLYSATQKATRADTADDAHSWSRDAASSAQGAINSAIDAGDYNAADAARDAYDYSRKAATAETAADARFYATQAEKAASSAQSSLNSASRPKSTINSSTEKPDYSEYLNDDTSDTSGSSDTSSESSYY